MVVHVLRANSRTRLYGVERDPDYGVLTYTTARGKLPTRFDPYTPGPHTWERCAQRLVNGEAYTPPTGLRRRPVIYRGDYQREAVTEIVAARTAGHGGYPLALPTGSGKTIIAIEAVNQMRPASVLVVSTLTHAPTWRRTISTHGDPHIEWVVTNPDQLGALLHVPGRKIHSLDVETRNRVAATHGDPFVPWDVIVCDEAHMLATADSERSQLWRRHARWGDDGPKAFTLNLSATPWTAPVETSSVAHILARHSGLDAPDAFTVTHDYPNWLRKLGFQLLHDVHGRWRWDNNPSDTQHLTRLLFTNGWGMSRDAEQLGIDPQPRTLHPIHLDADERALYEASWADFQARWHPDKAPQSQVVEPGVALSRMLRNVQKASLVKAPHVADIVAQLVRDGHQVIVPAWYSDTAHELGIHIARALATVPTPPEAPKPVVYVMTGQDSAVAREEKRRRFQSGIAKVLVTSVIESINLHAGEHGGGVDGEDATIAPRVTVFADAFTGGKRAFQAEGRGSRDGQLAPVIYTYAADTTEQAWLHAMFLALANTKALSFDGERPTQHDISSFMRLAQQLDPETSTEAEDPHA